MRAILTNKNNELAKEVEKLIQERADMLSRIEEIEIRLHQIVGAMSEINKLKNSLPEEE